MNKKQKYILLVGFIFLLLTACAPRMSAIGNATQAATISPEATGAPMDYREAQVQSVEIQSLPKDPHMLNVIVRGILTESCATLTDPQTSLTANTIRIEILTFSPSDRGCVQLTTPFEKIIPIDTTGLAPGNYTVIANGVSAVFSLAGETPVSSANVHLVVQANDRSITTVDANIQLTGIPNSAFNGFLPLGGSIAGIGYILDPNNPHQALGVGLDGPQPIEFVQDAAIYGLVTWPGSSSSSPRLAWGTGPSGLDQSSTIKISAPDGTQFDTLLTQDAPNPPTQLVPEFWSADGQSLYFSKEPIGLGGNILFGGGSNLYKIDISTKEVTEVIPAGPMDGPQACLDAISADYRYVADHCSQNIITVRDLVNGISATIQLPSDFTDARFVGSARFSPNGNHLAYALARGEEARLQSAVAITQLNGGSMLILSGQDGILYSLVGWLDDQTVLVQSTNLSLCMPDCATELWALRIDGSAPIKLADGRFLALVTGEFGAVPQPPGAPGAPIACRDAAEYISDDGKDGATYAPNTAFMKTWTIKNTGACTWDSNYLVFQISGAFMTQQPGYFLVPPGNTVAPGQSVDIVVGMTAPPQAGNYTSYWGLKNADGKILPVAGGANGNSFYTEINVSNGTVDTGAVTATSIDIVPEQGSGEACTATSTYFVHGYISTDGPATVRYEIGSSAGQISAGSFELNGTPAPYVEGLLQFEKAEDKRIDLHFIGPYPYPDDISVMLRVNGGDWVTTRLNCP